MKNVPKSQDVYSVFLRIFHFYCANCSLKSCIKLTYKRGKTRQPKHSPLEENMLKIEDNDGEEEEDEKNEVSLNNAFFCNENFHDFFHSFCQ